MASAASSALRPVNERSIEICHSCISYINDRFVFEKGLFRSPASLTDVRLLQTQMTYQGGSSRIRNESDPHIVTGVLQKTLKELNPSPLFEVYEDILSTEISEDSVHCRITVQNWLVKLPQDRFELVRTLFALLQRIATVGGNDSNAMQLAYYIAPYLCRRENSAYMSIRHMEDLRKIRPVVAFLVEHQSDVFSDHLKSVPQTRVSNQPSDASSLNSTYSSMNSLQGCGESVYNLQLPTFRNENSCSASSNALGSNAININKLRKNLSQLITSPNSNRDVDSHFFPINGINDGYQGDGDLDYYAANGSAGHNVYSPGYNVEDSTQSPPASAINTNSWEWKIFKSLLQVRVNSFIAGDGFQERSSESESTVATEEVNRTANGANRKYTGGGEGGGGANPGGEGGVEAQKEQRVPGSDSDASKKGSKGTSTSLHIKTSLSETAFISPISPVISPMVCDDAQNVNQNQGSRVFPSKGSLSDYLGENRGFNRPIVPEIGESFFRSTSVVREKGTRRARVTQCKNLRGFILGFERSWNNKHGEPVKDVERGDMQIFYTRYKEMKRVIRDDAAVDIQRCARGFKVRSHPSRFSGMLLAPGSSGDGVMGAGMKGVSGRDGGRKITEGSSFPQGLSSSFDRTMSDLAGGDSMDTGEGTCTVENKSSSPYKIDSAHNTSTMSVNMNISTTQENSDQSVLSRNSYRDSKDEVSYSSTTRQDDGSVSTSNLQFLAGTMIPYEMYRRYRTLLEQKRDIKKKLKSFDEQFSKEKGRAPKKTDKEVMRPLYQRYHEVRGELDTLQGSIEKKYGLIPLFSEDGGDPDKVTANAAAGSAVGSLPRTSGSSQHTRRVETGPGTVKSQSSSLTPSSDVPQGSVGSGLGSDPFSSFLLKSPASTTYSSNVVPPIERAESDQDLKKLHSDINDLHVFLKTYEKDFNKQHSRPVMSYDDIQPVVDEYVRYKDLKSILKSKKGGLAAKP